MYFIRPCKIIKKNSTDLISAEFLCFFLSFRYAETGFPVWPAAVYRFFLPPLRAFLRGEADVSLTAYS